MNKILHSENGDPTISLNNIIGKMNTDGFIVAVLHYVKIVEGTPEETTQVYYSKGSTHQATGLSVVNEIGFFALQTIVNLIPSMPNFIQIQRFQENNIEAVIDYSIPEDKILPIIKVSSGYVAYKQCLDILMEQKIKIIYSVKG